MGHLHVIFLLSKLNWLSLDQFPNIIRWHEKVGKRPAVIKGKDIPMGKIKDESDEERIKGIRDILS